MCCQVSTPHVNMDDMSEVLQLHQPTWSDRVISGTVTGLLTVRGAHMDDLVAATGISKSTLYRKVNSGRWTAHEVKLVADAFTVPVSDLYDGRVTPGPSLPECAARDSNPEPAGKGPVILAFRRAAA